MLEFTHGELQSEEKTIEALEANGIKVIMRPVALMPDNLESYHGIGRQQRSTIETDIYVALKQLEIRSRVIGDPFSETNIK